MSDTVRRKSNIATWREYYGSLAREDESGKFGEEFERTTFTHAWANSVRVIREKGGLADGDRVLDAGCGWGRMLVGLLEGNSDLRVTAMDMEPDALALGERLLSEPPNNNRVNWIVGDVEAIDQPDGAFDLVYSARVFQHLQSPERGVAELIRVLRPGGRFVLFLQNRLCPLNRGYYATMYSPQEVRGWFDGQDLRDLRTASMDFFPNALSRFSVRGLDMRWERLVERVPGINLLGGKAVAWGIK